MLHLTRKGDYAIRGMVYLAMQPMDRMSLISVMSSEIDVPQALLAKIFQNLGKVGLVKSSRGMGGGFSLGRPAAEISLIEIVEAVEGPIVLNRCLLRPGECDRDALCTVHPVWRQVQEKMRGILGSVTLRQLAGE
jgi:Rrf2 family transcriptional regulator, iron-sulfur cluster assembly transcription factor